MSRYFDDDLYHSSYHSEEEITHYGILGMKWGIRRYQPYSYTGGSGKEVGEAKKLAKLSGKSEKLQKRIDKLEKKRTNRFAIATNARYRGQMGDKQQKLIKKKAKIDKKIRSMSIIKNDKDVVAAAKRYNDLLNKAMTDKSDKLADKADLAGIQYERAIEKAINKHRNR